IGDYITLQAKYNKYWGSFEKLNPYVFIGIVLDPRHKLEKVVDYFEIIDGDMDEKVEANTNKVKAHTRDLSLYLYLLPPF
ncbi:DUF4413 domain-containing protein, partial [Shigella flexneri]|nr:DUF4413 domain-containing protein [Shigella flexneri]